MGSNPTLSANAMGLPEPNCSSVRIIALLEALLVVAAIAAGVWHLIPPTRTSALLVLLLMFLSHLAHKETPKDLGFRIDNLKGSTALAAKVMLPLLLVIVLLAIVSGKADKLVEPVNWAAFRGYLLWALLQQYILQSFIFRRIRKALGPSYAACSTAAIFSLIHMPNPGLALMTFVGGYLACSVFWRSPNLLPLALAHAVLGSLLSRLVPLPFMPSMRVGRNFYLD